ncbi:MAG TPA: ADP-ribosylglycohydrolase family protein [Methanospirillum sp.]|uniref:ADP-ribosylglycohydrolase family protein n=1 Tax=Methanospirillum sp. TaxID=45200 RepID=UPI002D1AA7FD|nr:ADP-ribosylglycohydrolase family protein [Methanospirillum sp.]HPY61229.1 ADP-ribosylglycohydrolase family protein [Methanospirillum sp.]
MNYSPGARMMLGIALGDSYGAPFENLSYKDAITRLKTHGLKPGRYTDDTQQALAIAEVIISGEEMSAPAFARSFLNSYARDPRPGYSQMTLGMLSSPDPETFLCSIPDDVRRERKTDGAAMRAPPVGFLPDKKRVIETAILSASITHGHQDAVTAACMTALLAHQRLYHKTRFSELWASVRDDVDIADPDTISWCDRCAASVLPDRELLLGEYASYGVPYTDSRIFLGVVVFLLTRFGDDLCRLLTGAIRIGGDTDTVAAVVMGIALARGAEESRIWELAEEIEDGPYGKKYLVSVGDALSKRYNLVS